MSDREFLNLWRLLTLSRGELLRLAFGGVGQATCSLLIALSLRELIRRHNGAGTLLWNEMLVISIPAMAAIVGLALLRRAETVWGERLAQNSVQAIRERVFYRLLRRRPADNASTTMLPFIGDLGAVRTWYAVAFARGLSAAVSLLVLILALTVIAPAQAGALAVVMASCALLTLPLSDKVRDAASHLRRQRGHLSSWISDRLSAIGLIQAHNRSRDEQARLATLATAVHLAAVDRARAAGNVRALAHGAVGAGSMLAVWVACSGSTAQHAAQDAILALTLISIAMPNVRELTRLSERLPPAQVAMHRLRRLLRRQRRWQQQSRQELRRSHGEIRFIGVSVEARLRPISFLASPMSRTAIVGDNGSGKSTLLALAARLFDPDQGRVELDSVDLTDLRLESVRRHVALVSPALPLLAGTLRDNLLYGARVHDEAQQNAILSACGFAEVLARLPKGMDTPIGSLSVGERAWVQIARAMLRRPRVLLLDEVEASLDDQSRERLANIVHTFQGTVVIATRDNDWAERVASHIVRLPPASGSETQATAKLLLLPLEKSR